jgi:hypothetical protein
MTPHERAHLQGQIVTSIQQAHPGAQKQEIAAAAGVSKSVVSRWDDEKDGDRLTIDALVGLRRRYGAPAVLGPIAAEGGCDVVPRDASGGESTGALSGRMVWLLGQLVTLHGEATAPESEGGSEITDAELLKYRPALLKALPVLRGLLALAERAMPTRRSA